MHSLKYFFQNAQILFETEMQIEETAPCLFDMIKIYNDLEKTSQQSCSICNMNSIPDAVTTTGRQMYVEFISDGSVEYHGFTAQIVSVTPETPVEVIGCGMSMYQSLMVNDVMHQSK